MKKNNRFNKICFGVITLCIILYTLIGINNYLGENRFMAEYSQKISELEERIEVLENENMNLNNSLNEIKTSYANLSIESEKTTDEEIDGPNNIEYESRNIQESENTENIPEIKNGFIESTEVTETNSEEDVPNKNFTDITKKSNLTADEFNLVIDKMLERYNITDGKLKNSGELFVLVEETSGVNGLFALSVATLESGYGRSGLCQNNNNWLGISKSGGGYRYFESDEECMIYWANLIKNSYIDQGRTTISEISTKYCPPNASKWTGDVTWAMETYASYLL